MIIKCPRCAENFKIEDGWLNRQGNCPYCQSSICFSAKKAIPTQRINLVSDNTSCFIGDMIFIFGVISVCVVIALSFISCSSKTEKETMNHHSYRHRDNGKHYREMDYEEYSAREFINSLPKSQQDVFRGIDTNSTDRFNFLANILESGNLGGVIKAMEHNLEE